VTEPTTGHLDLDRLAEHDEGLLTDIEAAAAEAHLRDCLACREQLAGIRATRALLGALPAEPMPAAVAARIDEALAGAVGTATVVPVLADRKSRWFNRPSGAGLAAAAVVAALVGAVVVGASVKDDDPTGDADVGALSTADAPEVAPAYPVLVTGTTYTPTNAESRVAELAELAGTSVAQDTDGGQPSALREAQPGDVPPETRSMFVSSEQLLTCVAKLTGDGSQVLPVAVDFVRFSNPAENLRRVPAVAILLPRAAGSKDGVYVVGPDCATAPDPSSSIYVFQVVPASS
jgi:hypothetical protein